MKGWLQHLSRAFEADLRTLALVRIGLGMVLLMDLVIRAGALEAHYTDFGVLPRESIGLSLSKWRVCLHLVTGSAVGQAALFALAGLCAVALLLGYRTRLATILCWVLTLSLQNRNPMVLTGGDTMLRCLLFWACFMPLGVRWSLDRKLSRNKLPEQTTVVNAGVAAFMLQIFVVHFFAGILKSGAEWRSEFTAIYYALEIDQLQLPLGGLLLELPMPFLKLMTASTMVAELVLPFLLFPLLLGIERWRNGIRFVVALTLIGFHVGLALTLRLGIFPWVNIVSILVFLPGFVWDKLPRIEGVLSGWMERIAAPLRKGALARWAGSPWSGLRPPMWETLTAVVLFLFVFYWNLSSLPNSPTKVPRGVRPIAYVLRLDQRWNLFAPKPYTHDGWYTIPGKLANGKWVDLYRDGAALGNAKPADVSAEYPIYRWRKYLRNIYLERNEEHRPLYSKWVCRQWNRSHSPEEQVTELRLVYMRETTPPPGGSTRVIPMPLGSQRCLDPDGNGGPPGASSGKASPARGERAEETEEPDDVEDADAEEENEDEDA